MSEEVKNPNEISENDLESDDDIDEMDETDESIPNESKNDKFVRIAEKRTNKIINAITKLGNLSNKINYQYTEEEVEQMFTAIEKQIQTEKDKFFEKPPVKFTFKK